MSSDTTANLVRYVVYVPYGPDAGTYSFRVQEDVVVEHLMDCISDHKRLKHHLKDDSETLSLYNVLFIVSSLAFC